MKDIGFNRIEDFFTIKKECPFCHSELKLMLTNFLITESDMPIFTSYLENDWFKLKFRHVTETHDVNLSVGIDVKNNSFHFQAQKADHIEYYISVFENTTPHLELYCPNKRHCKFKYYVATHGLKSNRYTDLRVLEKNKETYPAVIYPIEPANLYCESFVVDNFWVQNDYFHHCTYIHLRDKPFLNPLKTQMINLETMNSEHILMRVKTLVTFQ